MSPESPTLPPCRTPQVSQPMDLATVLARVDGRQYSTTAQYLADMALIVRVRVEGAGGGGRGAANVHGRK